MALTHTRGGTQGTPPYPLLMALRAVQFPFGEIKGVSVALTHTRGGTQGTPPYPLLMALRAVQFPFFFSSILSSTVGMYEHNQFVMNCGIIDTNAGPITLQ